jgi:hypothetical protein
VEARRSKHIKIGNPKIWHWKMEKDCKLEVLAWEINWADLYANSKVARAAIISRIYGSSFRSVSDLS